MANHLQVRHLDTDNFYWKRTDPPFRVANDRADRVRMFAQEAAGLDGWVLSGSMCGWGDPLLPRVTSVVFLYLQTSIRMARISAREQQRYGRRIAPDGDMHTQHLEFMSWAESYDSALAPTRSLDLHESWMHKLRCPLIRLESDQPVEALVQKVLDHVGA